MVALLGASADASLSREATRISRQTFHSCLWLFFSLIPPAGELRLLHLHNQRHQSQRWPRKAVTSLALSGTAGGMESGGGASCTSIRSLVQLQNSRHPTYTHTQNIHAHTRSISSVSTDTLLHLPPRCFRGLWVSLTWAPAIRGPHRHPKGKPWGKLPGSEHEAADLKVTPGKGPKVKCQQKHSILHLELWREGICFLHK